MLSDNALRIMLGRGLARHPGFVKLVREARLGRPVQVGVHHLDGPAPHDAAGTEFMPERPTRSPQEYVDECLRAVRAWEAGVFWPGRELAAVSSRLGDFVAAGIKVITCGSPDTLCLVEDKLSCGHAAAGFGIRVPPAIVFNDLEGFDLAYAQIADMGETVCFKPRRGIYGRGFRVVREGIDVFAELFTDPSYRIDRDDARRRFAAAGRFPDMLAMPWLAGLEYSVDCFRSADGGVFRGIARAKVSATALELRVEHETLELAARLSAGLNLSGLFNCQFRFHRDVPYLLEVNARPAGGIAVSSRTGIDLVELALGEALGTPIPQDPVASVRSLEVESTSGWVERAERTSWRSEPGSSPPEPRAPLSLRLDDPLRGRVVVRQVGEGWPLGSLLGLALRVGSSRPYLLVSRVLGKHLPVTPTRMEETHRALAQRLAADLPGPVLFLGMAETATGLGWGVYEQWRARTQRRDCLYAHSTRYLDASNRWLHFDESHSHAPRQALGVPAEGEAARCFSGARSLVVVDDELSTGRTAAALARSLSEIGITPGRRLAVGLVAAQADALVSDASPLSGWEIHALANFQVEYEGSPGVTDGARVGQGYAVLAPGQGARSWGRYGSMEAPRVPAATLERVRAAIAGSHRATLLGSGECMHPAFMLGRALEQAGHRVLLQSSTRSPIAPGGDIPCSMPCEDPLGSMVPFFLHNPPGFGSGVIVLHEPGGAPAAAALARALGGMAIEVWDA